MLPQSIDWLPLSELERLLDDYAQSSQPQLRSVLAIHKGIVLLERYWAGFSLQSYQCLNSITKSVVSALVGVALADGYLALSDTLTRWFPSLQEHPQAHAANVTVRDLLTMTAGFNRRIPMRGGYVKAADPIPTLLTRGTACAPGKQFCYSNADADLLAATLACAVDAPLVDYAHRRLFEPLGIWREAPRFLWKQNGTVKHAFSGWSHFDENSGRLWNTDNQGRARGSLGLHLTTRELAQFVQLYLQQGRWHGQQLIPADFVAASTVAQSRGEQPEKTRYGYLWWITVDQAGRQAYFAGGFGGQYVYIVPEQSIVIAITSSSRRGNGQTHRRTICPWISEAIDRVESTQN